MDAHRCEENDDPEDVGVLLWPWVDTDDHMEEEDASEQEVKTHRDMSEMASHQKIEDRCEVEREERAVEDRERHDRVAHDGDES
ncbi:unannotated protein [freshwater metagenome]|uniref:Unannotated protein n=1 Tax=freshwater metagenome TaxID=449393 RepID=A0A6J6DUY8_9ZZZZ